MDNGACSYRRFLQGDESAFREIMEEIFHKLVFFIDGYIHDVHAAEDLAVDVMADLIAHPHRYNFRVPLKTYLFMRGRSRALDHLRHRKVLRFEELSTAEHLADDAEALEDYVLTDERRRAVHAAVASLPADMRAVVHLIYFEEMTYAEAAKVMKKTVKQVDNLLYRAKKALRITLGKDGEWWS